MRLDKTEIEDRALKVRQEHNIQTYGVKDIFALIEQRDIHLIRYPFGKDVLLGFSTMFEGKKVIVSNSSEILSREIFTIAHELGHIIYDFEEKSQELKIDLDINESSEDISEARAYYFANCFLMPEEHLRKFIKLGLKKKQHELTAMDIVRIQIEFNVSYAAAVQWLYKTKIIKLNHKNELFNERQETTSGVLFKMVGADDKLLQPSEVIKVPARYYEYVYSNYMNNYIPFTSLQKALGLLGVDAVLLKKEDLEEKDEPDIDDIFQEYE